MCEDCTKDFERDARYRRRRVEAARLKVKRILNLLGRRPQDWGAFDDVGAALLTVEELLDEEVTDGWRPSTK